MLQRIFLLKNEHGNIESSLNYFLKFNIPKNARILDVGCGYGSLIYNIYKRGYKNTLGIEVNKKKIRKSGKAYPQLSKKIKYYSGDIIPFNEESFDAVLMFDVIEHIPKVNKFLKEEVYRVLKKGGIFIFQTPNKYINIPWEIINKRSFTKWKVNHCSLQTNKSLMNLLKESNFNNITIQKNNIITEHNKIKVTNKIGVMGLIILSLLQRMPINIYPNLWGYGRK